MTHFGFPKAYKLRSKKEIETLFSQGHTSFVFPLKVVWQLYPQYNEVSPIKVAVSVSKKRFKHAVTRNRIKRIIRESARMYFPEIESYLQLHNCSLVCVIIYVDTNIPTFKTVFSHLNQAFQQILRTHEDT